MSTTTFEEAKKCPKCGQIGEDVKQTPGRDGRGKPVTVHTIMCRTQLCRWFGTGYLVQVNEDGSIPDAYSGVANSHKQFPTISQESATKIEENILRQLEIETNPNANKEVRNPNS